MFERLQDMLSQIILYTALLAGFSFAVVIQVLTQERRSQVLKWTLLAFLGATASLLLGTWLSISLYTVMLLGGDFGGRFAGLLRRLVVLIMALSAIGTVAFLGGLACAGWIHSRQVGILSTGLALVSLLAMLVFYVLLSAVPIR